MYVCVYIKDIYIFSYTNTCIWRSGLPLLLSLMLFARHVALVVAADEAAEPAAESGAPRVAWDKTDCLSHGKTPKLKGASRKGTQRSA